MQGGVLNRPLLLAGGGVHSLPPALNRGIAAGWSLLSEVEEQRFVKFWDGSLRRDIDDIFVS